MSSSLHGMVTLQGHTHTCLRSYLPSPHLATRTRVQGCAHRLGNILMFKKFYCHFLQDQWFWHKQGKEAPSEIQRVASKAGIAPMRMCAYEAADVRLQQEPTHVCLSCSAYHDSGLFCCDSTAQALLAIRTSVS